MPTITYAAYPLPATVPDVDLLSVPADLVTLRGTPLPHGKAMSEKVDIMRVGKALARFCEEIGMLQASGTSVATDLVALGQLVSFGLADRDTKAESTSRIAAALAAFVGAAPEALNQWSEIVARLNNDSDALATLTNAIAAATAIANGKASQSALDALAGSTATALGSLAAKIGYAEAVVDITGLALYTLPDPQGRDNGAQTIVRFTGTNGAAGVCEVKTLNNRDIVYVTTGPSFYTPGRGELVRFIARDGVYVAEILQGGAGLRYSLMGSGTGWETPTGAWVKAAMAGAPTGDIAYNRTINGEHIVLPCHGAWSIDVFAQMYNGSAGVGGMYIAGGKGSNPAEWGYLYSGLVPNAQDFKTHNITGMFGRDEAFSYWRVGTGAQFDRAIVRLSATFLGR